MPDIKQMKRRYLLRTLDPAPVELLSKTCDYDVVVVGTGLAGSVLAAALTMQHKRVLHIDRNDWYGELDASLNIRELDSWTKNAPSGVEIHSATSLESFELEVDQLVVIQPYGQGVIQQIQPLIIQFNGFNIYCGTQQGVIPLNHVKLRNLLENARINRACALNLSGPGVLLSQGTAVSTLLTSKVCDYVEFKPLPTIQVCLEGELVKVPCNKGDVFTSNLLQPLEKRSLMKLLQLSIEYNAHIEQASVDQFNERTLQIKGSSLKRPQNKRANTSFDQVLHCIEKGSTFLDYLQSNYKFHENQQAVILHALAMSLQSSTLSLHDGLTKLNTHVNSLGTFGSTAFIVPLYGTGELAQAYCRKAAVLGATYMLRQQIKSIDSYNLTLQSDDEQIVVSARKVVQCTYGPTLHRISLCFGSASPSIVLIPPSDQHDAIYVNILNHETLVCPLFYHVIHMTTTQSKISANVESVLKNALKQVISTTDELYHVTFSTKQSDPLHPQILTVPSPSPALSMDPIIDQAKTAFEMLYPDLKFMDMAASLKSEIQPPETVPDDEAQVLSTAMDFLKSPSQEEDDATLDNYD